MKNTSWKIDGLWRLDSEAYNLIVYQISALTNPKPITVVFRERYEFQGFVRMLVYASSGTFDPNNTPWGDEN